MKTLNRLHAVSTPNLLTSRHAGYFWLFCHFAKPRSWPRPKSIPVGLPCDANEEQRVQTLASTWTCNSGSYNVTDTRQRIICVIIKKTKTGFSFFFCKSRCFKNNKYQKFYLKILSTKASHHIIFSQRPVKKCKSLEAAAFTKKRNWNKFLFLLFLPFYYVK